MFLMKVKQTVNAKIILTGILFVLLCIPAFGMTGSVVKPLLVCVVGSILICTALSFFKVPEGNVGYALLILMYFWLIFAVIKEFVLQFNAGFHFYWIEFFYFDKLLILGAIWLSVSLFFALKRLFFNKNHDSEFLAFFKYSSRSFLVFYVFLLVYSFVLIRMETADYPFRFQPFVTIKEYISDWDTIPYEVFMMFFGNLFYFTPLGYIFGILLRNKSRLFSFIINLVFPLFTFTLLEFSQYFFQNGYCEFDDMMMNTLGFWCGNIMYILSNKFAAVVSKGEYTAFWG